jgi:hypothetical protein
VISTGFYCFLKKVEIVGSVPWTSSILFSHVFVADFPFQLHCIVIFKSLRSDVTNMKYQMNYIYTKLLTLKESPNMAGT